jgi:hypothetical protein
MADITMCRDEHCKRHLKCHRMTAPVTEFRQAYFVNSPRQGKKCDFFWDNKGYQKQEDICGK